MIDSWLRLAGCDCLINHSNPMLGGWPLWDYLMLDRPEELSQLIMSADLDMRHHVSASRDTLWLLTIVQERCHMQWVLRGSGLA